MTTTMTMICLVTDIYIAVLRKFQRVLFSSIFGFEKIYAEGLFSFDERILL